MTSKELDAEYEKLGDQVSNIIELMVINRMLLDALMMSENEKETGLRQAPRSKDHFEDLVMKDLPF